MLMKFARPIVVATAIAGTFNFLSLRMVEGAAALCVGACEIDLGMTCEEVLEMYVFAGDCCSLVKGEGGNCTMLTTSDCYYQPEGEGDIGCQPLPDGSELCIVPGVVYYANSTEACPASEYDVVLNVMEDMEDLYGEEEPDTGVDADTKEPASAPIAPPSSAESVGSHLFLILSSVAVAGGALLLA